MTKFDELPRGQLSNIILMCLQDKDKYGYEIIDDVYNKTNGTMQIKQPSLYSSLKRMEEQSLISSYWRDSEIGGRRHYYHITDLGKKNLEKWKTNFSFPNSFDQKQIEQENKVLQQTNLFNLTSSNAPSNYECPDKKDDEEKNDVFVQFDLFSNKTIVTPPAIEPSEHYALPSDINCPEKHEQSPILTSYEKPEEISSIKKFDYIKKCNKSFSENIRSISSINQKKFVEQYNYNITIDNEATPPVFLKNLKENSCTETMPQKMYDSFVKNLKNNDEADINQEQKFVDLNVEISNIKENQGEDISNKISVTDLPGYLPKNSDNNTIINHQNEANIEPSTAVDIKPNNKKDDGVIITERIDIKDIPKQPKFEARRYEVYISDDTLSPKFKQGSANYEDRINDLYEKSKSNAENQQLEVIDSKIKFSSYNDLKNFYKEQNINFKPYNKALHKSEKNFDMIKICKLNLFTSLIMFSSFTILSLLMYIVLSSINTINISFPLIFAVLPFISLCVFIGIFFIHQKSPEKRVAYDINKFKFNISLFIISLCVIPIVFALNLISGFNFYNFNTYAVTILYPCLLAFTYLIYYICQKLLIKSKSMY